MLEGMSEALENKEKVSIVNFGSLTPTVRGARKARNPKTGEVVHVNTKRTKEDKADKTALNLRITELEGRMLDCYTNHQDQMIEAMDKYTEAIQDLEVTIMKKIK